MPVVFTSRLFSGGGERRTPIPTSGGDRDLQHLANAHRSGSTCRSPRPAVTSPGPGTPSRTSSRHGLLDAMFAAHTALLEPPGSRKRIPGWPNRPMPNWCPSINWREPCAQYQCRTEQGFPRPYTLLGSLPGTGEPRLRKRPAVDRPGTLGLTYGRTGPTARSALCAIGRLTRRRDINQEERVGHRSWRKVGARWSPCWVSSSAGGAYVPLDPTWPAAQRNQRRG